MSSCHQKKRLMLWNNNYSDFEGGKLWAFMDFNFIIVQSHLVFGHVFKDIQLEQWISSLKGYYDQEIASTFLRPF